ncbi:LysM peptidoglycan-binding domain-containing protein [Bacillus sp. FJAT-22090]|uniref:LysM peptidoglycan-binding domain-containing protein n=1 Tax=Bacillus sp. FJAT-22090 TaxID=1581038 RepID=UPI00119E85E0|nr:LysM peptidoglycan-binding domain-containing protein [Bacillus sp. FJAT-22090]
MQVHIVEKGDTLWKISRSYGVSFDELKKLNAHLANPEYIVPGMKIFIPDTKKMESINHPYSESRPVKKEMVRKEETKAHPVPPKAQTVPPKAQTVPPKAQTVPPKAQTVPPKAQTVPPKAQPVQPIPVVPPVQPKPLPSYTLPYHMMPVPDLDLTPSPQGWRLVESTSIHIQAHFHDHEKPTPAPAPPVQQQTKPVEEEPSPTFSPMYPCPPMQEYPCYCPPMQEYPNMMHPQMHPQMQSYYGGYPCVQICYVPVYPCPPYPYQNF